MSCDTNADQQHDAFSSRLQKILDILRPHIRKPDNERTKEKTASSGTTAIELGFSKLALQDTTEDDEESNDQPVIVDDLPSVPAVEISLDDANVEEDFFLEIKGFLKEMQSIRKYVLERWTRKSDLMTKAFVTNTAIAIVRQKEYEFDQSLSRPPQYPAELFPVWCLPALLLFRELYPEKLGDESDLDEFILPSDLVGTSGAKSLLCFYPVYNGLKLLLDTIQLAPKSQHPGAVLVHNLSEEHKHRDMHPHVLGARDMASVLYVFRKIPMLLHNIPEDELTRGVRCMDKERAIPFWLTFAMQIQLEINDLPKESLGDPLEDLRREVTKASTLIQEIKTHPNSLVDVHRGKDFDSLETLVLHLKESFFNDGVALFLQGVVKSFITSPNDRSIRIPTQLDPLCPGISFVKEKNLFLRSHRLRCGVYMYVMRSLVRKFPISHDANHSHVLSVAHLYNICCKLFPDAPRFPDLEFFMQRQDLERLFYGKIPQDIMEAQRRLELLQYGVTDAINGHSYRTISTIGKRLLRSRVLQSPSHLDSVLEDQFDMREVPLTLQKVDESTRRLLNSFGDKKQEHERIRLFNWPADALSPEGWTYHRLFFHKFDKIWDPVPILRSVMLWLEADAINLNFCTPKLVLLCSDILRDILDMFRSDPVFENDFLKEQNKPTLSLTIVLRILTLAANEIKLRKRQPSLPAKRMDQLREVFNIMQKHYMRPMETTPGEKTWAGDVCIADLVNTEEEPQIGEYWSAANFFSGRDIFAHGGGRIDPNNLGPAAAENLYKNWDFGGSKEESRMFNALSRFHAGRGERAIVSRALEGRYG
ncbi:hypothetical protein J4E89_006498 [Alternaria sp. Ai002NY15]|nr:hypothetical protein J4E89_006498 [Alternaria sp. Ai002NY15]